MSWTQDLLSCYWIVLLKGYVSRFSIVRASGDGILHLELLKIRTFPWLGIQDNNTRFREVNLFPSSSGIVEKRLLTRILQKELLSVTGLLERCVLLFSFLYETVENVQTSNNRKSRCFLLRSSKAFLRKFENTEGEK